MHRRTFLTTVGGAAVVGATGCQARGPPDALAPASDEPVAATGRWNQHGGGPGHARAADGPGPGDAVESRWRYAVSGDEHLRPRAVVDETVFATDSETLVAIDAARGEQRWRAAVGTADADPFAVDAHNVYLAGGWIERDPSDASLTTYFGTDDEVRGLTLTDDRIYYVAGTNVVAAEPGVSRAQWSVDLSDVVDHRIDDLFVTGETVAATSDSAMIGLALSDGSRRWQYNRGFDDVSYVNVAARAGSLYVSPVPEGPVRAVDAATGTERWRYDHGYPAFVAADGETVVLGGTPRQGSKHRAEVLDASGEQLWATPEERNDSTYDPPLVADGTVYASHVAGVFAYDRASGDHLWSLPAGSGGDLYPIGDLVVAGSGLFLEQDGDVYGLGPG